MPIELAIGIFPREMRRSIEDVVRCVKSAEEAGFTHTWLVDSQMLTGDVYVALTACAFNTSRIRLGTGVTNPLTRHPIVTARAILSLDEVSKGRAVLGIGAGDTAVKPMGALPASLDTLGKAIEVIRKLTAGEDVDFEGLDFGGRPRRYREHFAGVDPRPPVPIYLAANGPKMIRLAGMVADGVIASVGATEQIIRYVQESVREGAERAGRDPEEVKTVFEVGCSVSEDGVEAKREVKTYVARRPIAPVPREVTGFTDEDVHRAKQSYNLMEHLSPDAAHAKTVPDEWVERFAVAGTPEEVVRKVKVFERLGASQVFFLPIVRDSVATINIFRERILPHFR